MITILETFHERDLDGELTVMHVCENVITFGGLFEETFRVNLHGLASERQSRVAQCFEWFRHYAPLFSRSEFRACWRAYERACRQCSDSTRSAFWRFLDGYQLRSDGRHPIRYVKK
jgi:hypothetical protein